MGPNRTNTEQFQLRLPPGLRDRIKAYAERHDRSINAEIVRLLEREFPEQWPVTERVDELSDLLLSLKAGASDERLDQLIAKLEETVEGIASGRVSGVDAAVSRRVKDMWRAVKERESEEQYEAAVDAQSDLDDEEVLSLERNGTTEKFATPPAGVRDDDDDKGIPF